MRTRRALSLCSILAALPASASAATFYVATDGDDGNSGDMGAPWQTLQHAADSVTAGDTVIVRPGAYAGFNLEESGADGMPITFSAEDGVEITSENPETPDGINLEGASWVVLEGFTVNGMERAGLRTVTAEHVTLRNNQGNANGSWGILTGFVDDLLIEHNRMSGSIDEHGIYVSNSGDRPVIRNNVLFGNAANGLHMNGDAEQGGDGIISNALVEGNVLYSNGMSGGSGINCDGVQDSLIVNNLIYDAHASGISLYQIDGGGPASNNRIINNTVVIADDGRWALNIQNDSSGTTVYNNVFLSLHPSRGAIDLCGPGCLSGFTSDYNVVVDVFTPDDSDFISLTEWQTATGQDMNSIVADSDAVFVDAAGGDYHLSDTSPALDSGTSTEAPASDLDGNQRPFGDAVDIGAYEACGTDCVPGEGGAGGSPDTGGAGGTGGTGGSGGSAGNTPAGGTSTTGGSGGASSGSGGSSAGGTPSSGGATSGAGGSAAGNANGGSGGSTGGASSGGASAGAGTTDDEGGCGCRVAGGPQRSPGALLLAVMLVFGLRRRFRTFG